MSDLEPMEVQLKEDADSFRSDPRHLGAVKLKALREKISDLVEMKMLVREPHAYCSLPAFMVPKKNGKWRMVVDMRRLNEMVKKSGGGLPHLETQLTSKKKRQ